MQDIWNTTNDKCALFKSFKTQTFVNLKRLDGTNASIAFCYMLYVNIYYELHSALDKLMSFKPMNN